MPGMDGWAVWRQRKADPALQTIPVAMVTVVDDERMAFSLGASEYLTKPVDRSSPAPAGECARERQPGPRVGGRG